METISLESLVAGTILSFCENLAELGCPKDAEPDMWFRNMSDEERFAIADKLMEIEEKNTERFKDGK